MSKQRDPHAKTAIDLLKEVYLDDKLGLDGLPLEEDMGGPIRFNFNLSIRNMSKTLFVMKSWDFPLNYDKTDTRKSQISFNEIHTYAIQGKIDRENPIVVLEYELIEREDTYLFIAMKFDTNLRDIISFGASYTRERAIKQIEKYDGKNVNDDPNDWLFKASGPYFEFEVFNKNQVKFSPKMQSWVGDMQLDFYEFTNIHMRKQASAKPTKRFNEFFVKNRQYLVDRHKKLINLVVEKESEYIDTYEY